MQAFIQPGNSFTLSCRAAGGSAGNRTGRRTLDIDGGEVLDDTRDLKLRMNDNFTF